MNTEPENADLARGPAADASPENDWLANYLPDHSGPMEQFDDNRAMYRLLKLAKRFQEKVDRVLEERGEGLEHYADNYAFLSGVLYAQAEVIAAEDALAVRIRGREPVTEHSDRDIFLRGVRLAIEQEDRPNLPMTYRRPGRPDGYEPRQDVRTEDPPEYKVEPVNELGLTAAQLAREQDEKQRDWFGELNEKFDQQERDREEKAAALMALAQSERANQDALAAAVEGINPKSDTFRVRLPHRDPGMPYQRIELVERKITNHDSEIRQILARLRVVENTVFGPSQS